MKIHLQKEIDRLKVDVEEECLKILALHQPVAVDLRFLITALKMNHDLERIGDLATNIAEDTIYAISGEIIRHGQGDGSPGPGSGIMGLGLGEP